MEPHYDILEYILKWLIPFVCAGAFTLIVVPQWNKFKKGNAAVAQEDWNSHASTIYEQIDLLKQKDKMLEDKIDYIQNDLMVKLQADISIIKESMKQNQLRDLIVDGKHYLAHGEITIDQLTNYNDRFQVYKSLGGNGHADIWVKKVRELPIKDANELDLE